MTRQFGSSRAFLYRLIALRPGNRKHRIDAYNDFEAAKRACGPDRPYAKYTYRWIEKFTSEGWKYVFGTHYELLEPEIMP